MIKSEDVDETLIDPAFTWNESMLGRQNKCVQRITHAVMSHISFLICAHEIYLHIHKLRTNSSHRITSCVGRHRHTNKYEPDMSTKLTHVPVKLMHAF